MAKRWRRRMGVMILCSMAGTTLMLALQGRIREAVPLHLCSVSALAAAALAFSPAPFVVDFLWLLGMPGAVLALVFPAPAVSRWQTAGSMEIYSAGEYVCSKDLYYLEDIAAE